MKRSQPRRRAAIAAIAIILFAGEAGAQNRFAQWTTWAALQAVPSPGLTLDHGGGGTSVVGELRWQVVPLNYSFNSNDLVSPAQFFLVNPFRRHAGSVEAFVEPAWALQPYRRSGDDRFGAGYGVRLFLPLADYGEALSFSVGTKYLVRDAAGGEAAGTGGLELGLYTLFGLVGVRLDLTGDPSHRASFSLALKYY
jgi:hypothetical protein